MRRRWHGLLTGLLLCFLFAYPQMTLAADEAVAKIPVHIEENETPLSGAKAILTPDADTYPMPNDDTVTTDANGDAVFEIAYTAIADYRYTIRQVIPDPKEEGVTYDETVYVILISTVYDADGKIVPQVSVHKEDSEDKTDQVIFANTRKQDEPKPETVEIPVKKIWSDENDKDKLRPASVTMALLANGEATGQNLTLNKENSWQGSFASLPKESDGKEITYSVKEEAVEGYTSTVTGDVKSGFTVTNTHTPKEEPTPTPTETVTPTPTETVTPPPSTTPSVPPITPTTPPGKTTTTTTVKTGDESNIALWIALMAIAAAALGCAVVIRKRKKSQ